MDRRALLDDFDALLGGDGTLPDFDLSSEQTLDKSPEQLVLSQYEQQIIRRMHEDSGPISGTNEVQDDLARQSFRSRLLTAELEKELGCCIALASKAEALADLSLIDSETKKLILCAGKRARTRMICSNLRLVAHLVNQTSFPTSLEFDDLIEEGVIGLIIAVDRYDYTRGFRFSTYAHWWIRQAIDRAIKNNTFPIRLPVHVLEDIRLLMRTYRRITHREQREHVSCERLSVELHWPVQKVRRLLVVSSIDYVSAERPVASADGVLIRDFLISDTSSPEQKVSYSSMQAYIETCLGCLNDRDASIIRRRYGLGRLADEETLESIGESLGLTRERIRQIQLEGLKRLRKRFLASGLHE